MSNKCSVTFSVQCSESLPPFHTFGPLVQAHVTKAVNRPDVVENINRNCITTDCVGL